MNDKTKELLKDFIQGIPTVKRKLQPDLSNYNDYKRLIKVSINLLEENDSLDTYEIRSVCEEVGEEYSDLLQNPQFIEDFVGPIYSKIDNAKFIIDIYRSLEIENK